MSEQGRHRPGSSLQGQDPRPGTPPTSREDTSSVGPFLAGPQALHALAINGMMACR